MSGQPPKEGQLPEGGSESRASEESGSPTVARGGRTLPGLGTGEPAEAAIAQTVTHLAEVVSALHDKVAGGEGGGAPRRPRLPDPLKPEPFDGDSTKLRAFLARVRLYLGAFESAPDADKARAVASFLKGAAMRQYMLLCQDMHPHTPSLGDVLHVLERRFADQNEESDARYKFQHARQLASQSVLAFANYLDELSMTPGLDDLRNEVSMKERLLTGMHASLRHALLTCKRQLHTMDDVLEFAIDAERDFARMRGRSLPQGAPGSSRSNTTRVGLRSMEAADEYADPWVEAPPPDLQGQVQHLTAQLAAMKAAQRKQRPGKFPRPKPPKGERLVPGKDRKTVPVQCYQCNRWGHFQKECPAGPGQGQPLNG